MGKKLRVSTNEDLFNIIKLLLAVIRLSEGKVHNTIYK